MMKFGTKSKIAAGVISVAALVSPFVSGWEGRSLKAYRDIAGIVTICDGDTNDVRMGQTATHEECNARLIKQLQIHEKGMLKCIGVALPSKTQQAFLSFTYNVGVGAFCNSKSVAARINAGDVRGACEGLMTWNKARVNGVLREVQGLTNRRKAERKLCLEGLR